MDPSKSKEFSPAVLLLGICKAQAAAFLTGGLLLLIFSGIACGLQDPGAVIPPLSLVALCLSALAGGIGAVRFTGDGLLSGLCSGVLTMFLVRCMAMLPAAETAGMETGHTVLFYCLLPVLSVCGAVIGKRRKKSTRKKGYATSRRKYR